jgi:hypothetical protein
LITRSNHEFTPFNFSDTIKNLDINVPTLREKTENDQVTWPISQPVLKLTRAMLVSYILKC